MHVTVTAKENALAARESLGNNRCSSMLLRFLSLKTPTGKASRGISLSAWTSDHPSVHVEQEWKL